MKESGSSAYVLGMLRIVALGLCLLAMPSQAFAMGLYCAQMMNVPAEVQQEPTVPFKVYTIPAALIGERYCRFLPGADVTGCTYTLDNGKNWIIVLADTLMADDHECVLRYEKTHLPPNCWGDPDTERPESIATIKSFCR